MKNIAIAVAALFTAAAPAAFADRYEQDSPRTNDSRYDSRYDNSNRYDNTNRYDNRDNRRDDRRGDSARVLETKPLYAAGHAREECWNQRAGHYEELRESKDTRIGKGAAIGAVAGGVLGHQVGSGNGNTAATAGGAILGGLLGHQLQKRNEADDQPDLDRSRCRVMAENGAAPLGYDVRYEHNGREYVTRMDHDPGRTIRIGRDVREDGSPLDDTAPYRREGYSSR